MAPPRDPQLTPDPLLQIKLSGIFSTAADAGRTAVFITAQGPLAVAGKRPHLQLLRNAAEDAVPGRAH